jgi:CRISPR/Cas system-associated protein Cas10 (large subunit of type III CRISPR-Cas system)
MKNYEFFCDNSYKKDKWIKTLKEEKTKLVKKIVKKFDKIFEMEEKKKIIFDKFNFPLIENNKTYIKDFIDETILADGSFLIKDQS